MSVAFVDGPMVIDFVNSGAFDKSVDGHFDKLDHHGNGELSRDDLQMRFGKYSTTNYELQSREEIRNLYDALFEKFDADRNGAIDREEFRTLMKEIMLAKARGLGNLPVPIILQQDSLLMSAVEHKKSV